ncbi:MAG TPA: phosphate-starvation-inducible PsiE family protein [Sulfuricaulis sp.]|nr:phosphate-starvation-inducible PsiE family protein [Sulfuricaulis sp.]
MSLSAQLVNLFNTDPAAGTTDRKAANTGATPEDTRDAGAAVDIPRLTHPADKIPQSSPEIGDATEDISARTRAAIETSSSSTMQGNDLWASIADIFSPALVRVLTSLLIVALCLWMGAGIVNVVLDLRQSLSSGWAGVAERAIIDTLIMLALLEVIRTLQAYLKLGRVRVTFILDTALVVLIGELMGLWFKEYAPEKVLLGLGVIVTLVALRIVTARFSPERGGEPA